MKYAIYTLNEPHGHGICPICRQDWTTDPHLECDCTRTQPDDDQQQQAAYCYSAQRRATKLKHDQFSAERQAPAATPASGGVVKPGSHTGIR